MGRKATFNDPVRQVVQTSEDQHKYDTPTFRRLQINAGQPLNMMVTPNYKDQAGMLSTAFAEAMPSLITASALMASKAQNGEEESGFNSRAAEIGLDPEKSEKLGFFSSSGFKKGYYRAYGIEKGQVAKEQLQADWDADPNRNEVTTDEWARNWYKKNTEGLNGYAISGFNKEVAPALAKLAQQGAIEKISDVEASVYQQRFNILTSDWKSGTWTPEQAKKRQEELGLSNTDFDSLQVKVLTQFAKDGDNPEAARQALKVMSMNRPDGTPGIAFKSNIVKSGWTAEMASQIEQWSQEKTRLREQSDGSARTQEQIDLQTKVLEMAYKDGNPQRATAELNKAMKSTPGLVNVFLANNLQKRINEFASNKKQGSGGDGEGAALSKEELRLINGLSDKTLGSGDVLESLNAGKINKRGFASVLSMAGALNKNDKGVFKTPDFQAAERYMGNYSMGKNDVDIDGLIKENYDYLNAINANELRKRVADGEKAMDVAKDIRDRSMSLVKSGALRNRDFIGGSSGSPTPTPSQDYNSKYATFDEFDRAQRAGQVSGATLRAEMKYWAAKRNQQNQGETK